MTPFWTLSNHKKASVKPQIFYVSCSLKTKEEELKKKKKVEGEGLDDLNRILQTPAPPAGCSSWCQVATHHTFSQAQLLTFCKQLPAVELLTGLRA